MNNMLKNLVIWLVIGLVLMTVFNQFNNRQATQPPMEYSQFLEEVKSGRIAKVTIEGRQLKATTADGKRVTSYSPGGTQGASVTRRKPLSSLTGRVTELTTSCT